MKYLTGIMIFLMRFSSLFPVVRIILFGFTKVIRFGGASHNRWNITLMIPKAKVVIITANMPLLQAMI
jgi:hypothetical protein